jgi:hypothetical protein
LKFGCAATCNSVIEFDCESMSVAYLNAVEYVKNSKVLYECGICIIRKRHICQCSSWISSYKTGDFSIAVILLDVILLNIGAGL